MESILVPATHFDFHGQRIGSASQQHLEPAEWLQLGHAVMHQISLRLSCDAAFRPALRRGWAIGTRSLFFSRSFPFHQALAESMVA